MKPGMRQLTAGTARRLQPLGRLLGGGGLINVEGNDGGAETPVAEARIGQGRELRQWAKPQSQAEPLTCRCSS